MTTPQPVLSGEIPKDGVLALLRDVEGRRTSGVLRVTGADGVTHEVLLVAGQLALEQPAAEGKSDPVEALLAMKAGRYEILQRLPELPISKGDDLARTGSLAVHVPADLMAYCETSGLTGLLVLERDGRRAEAAYDRGELVAIRLDGRDDGELGEVFAWEDGTFEIEARVEAPAIDEEAAAAPEAPPPAEPAAAEEPARKPRKDDTGLRFLRVVEVALGTIVEEREKRRSPTRTSPPLPPPKKPRALPTTEPPEPPRRSRPDTVKVIYLRAEGQAPDASPSTRHIRTDVTTETVLPDARPNRRSRSHTPAPSASAPAAGPAGLTPTLASYLVLAAVAVLAAAALVAALAQQ